LVSVVAPDRHGNSEEITLNYRTLEEMIANHGPYYGCIAGRVANRIAKGTFAVDGTTYNVAVNNGQNHLHGGLKGFDQVIWKAVPYCDEASGVAGVELRYTSADGEEGYPGTLEVRLSYLYQHNCCSLIIPLCIFAWTRLPPGGG
jgi:aldose 1-epimerase